MITLPAGSRSFRGSHPTAVAAHQRPSGRSHSTRTDRSTITSPTPTRSRTQISPGIHGATQHPNNHNHSPPRLTQAPVQISDSAESARLIRPLRPCTGAGTPTAPPRPLRQSLAGALPRSRSPSNRRRGIFTSTPHSATTGWDGRFCCAPESTGRLVAHLAADETRVRKGIASSPGPPRVAAQPTSEPTRHGELLGRFGASRRDADLLVASTSGTPHTGRLLRLPATGGANLVRARRPCGHMMR
jgi:hypothetical protein